MTATSQATPTQPSFEARAAQAQRDVQAELNTAEQRIAQLYTALLVEPKDGHSPEARRLMAILDSLRNLQKLYPPITPARKSY
nr:hypothetical protein [Pseudomonas juntendi]